MFKRHFHIILYRLLLPSILAILIVLSNAVLNSHDSKTYAASCSSLQRQLNSLSIVSGGSSNRYKKAAHAQRKAISSAQSRLRQNGCRAKRKLFARSKHPSCNPLRKTIRRMNKNLRSLENKAGGGSTNTRSKRRRIIRAMKRQRCGDTHALNSNSKRTSILEQIFGKSESRRRRKQAKKDRLALLKRNNKNSKRADRNKKRKKSKSSEPKNLNYSTVHTICVRTCDGYYFPVSFSLKKRTSVRTTDVCNNYCPGTDMKLYVQKSASQSLVKLVSVEDGTPYTSLPTAFAYRNSYNPSCACNFRLLDRSKDTNKNVINSKEDRANEQRTIARIARPVWRIDKGQDPETLANQRGNLSPETIQKMQSQTPANDQFEQNKKVRVIDDSFFSNQ